jgi:PadR family transcriptional regulator PadR
MGDDPSLDLPQGTLDLLILKTIALEPQHGWAIALRILQVSSEALRVQQGSLYPALHRLEVAGDVRSEMQPSENNRRARVYTITAAGQRRLKAERKSWEHFALSMQRVLDTE